ncbi:hypothetical protein B7463_g1018, partial [Scytalidium lignicola]
MEDRPKLRGPRGLRRPTRPTRPIITCPHPREALPSGKYRFEQIQYRTKDSSKLRRLLRERHLTARGEREQLIARLENSTIDYNMLTDKTLERMIGDRALQNPEYGTKEEKIKRLRINDRLDRDTGSLQDVTLQQKIIDHEMTMHGLFLKEVYILKCKSYAKMKPENLMKALQKRNLPTSGSTHELIKRLRTYEFEEVIGEFNKVQELQNGLKLKFEERVGHPVDISTIVGARQDVLAFAEDRVIRGSTPVRIPEASEVDEFDWGGALCSSLLQDKLLELCMGKGIAGGTNNVGMGRFGDNGKMDYEK